MLGHAYLLLNGVCVFFYVQRAYALHDIDIDIDMIHDIKIHNMEIHNIDI